MSNKNPFKTEAVPKGFIFKKYLKKEKIKKAFIEINNLFANNDNVRNISPESINNIFYKNKIKKIPAKYQEKLADFYRVYLSYCLYDKYLSEEEISDLLYIKNLLSLKDDEIDKINKIEVEATYKKAIDEVLTDGSINQDEKDFLDKLEKNLKLPDELAREIYIESSNKLLGNYLTEAISDQKLSPEEESELNSIAKNLGIKLDYSENTKKILDKCRLFWVIENGDIPEITTEIILKKNEKCFFAINSKWFEYRRITKRYQYKGPTVRIKIVKGLYYRAGDIKINKISNDILTKIDEGKLFLTSKKIQFFGNQKNIAIQLNKIVDFTVYKNGIEIQKESGKSPFIEIEDGSDVFAAILARLLQEK